MNNTLLPFLWFLAILALIPLMLWLLKRSKLVGGAATGVMRVVATLPLAPNQRLLTVEVGQGEDRRWLVLGVTGAQITTLHSMPPQAEAPAIASAVPFAQLLKSRLGGGHGV